MSPPKKTVQVNEAGLRIGEDHPRAKLTNREIELFFQLRAEGYGYGMLAKFFEISKAHAQKICNGRSRCQTATRFKEVKS
jgi:hypothetical protein